MQFARHAYAAVLATGAASGVSHFESRRDRRVRAGAVFLGNESSDTHSRSPEDRPGPRGPGARGSLLAKAPAPHARAPRTPAPRCAAHPAAATPGRRRTRDRTAGKAGARPARRAVSHAAAPPTAPRVPALPRCARRRTPGKRRAPTPLRAAGRTRIARRSRTATRRSWHFHIRRLR
jgi:hypothetical protein